jgi:ABC-type dipeptide/oligopeptide/nickel transport system permease component
MFLTVVTLAVNLAVDLVQLIIDPRLRRAPV